jgi:hypothetical protein
MSNVLILFQAKTEAVEQLALAVAVGAVEAEGSIRLRRLTSPDAPELGHKSYGTLHAADLSWADVIVVGLEDPDPNPTELGPLFDLLQQTPLASKHGWTFGPHGPGLSPTGAQSKVEDALRAARITLMPPVTTASSQDLIATMKESGQASVAKSSKS